MLITFVWGNPLGMNNLRGYVLTKGVLHIMVKILCGRSRVHVSRLTLRLLPRNSPPSTAGP